MKDEINDWLAQAMKAWIDAFQRPTSIWSMATGSLIQFPVTAGVPYGFQNLHAVVLSREMPYMNPWALAISFGAYQFRMNERMVRVDLYRHSKVPEWQELSVEPVAKNIEMTFGDLMVGPDRMNPPEPHRKSSVVGGTAMYEMAGWWLGKADLKP